MASDLGHWNIEASVFRDRVEELHFISDPARNIRRERQKHVWHVGRFLGRGGFGEVRLQHNHDKGTVRAVKQIVITGHELSGKECEIELQALLEFSKPKFKEAACFVEFYGWFTDGPEIFLAMEFLPLGDLETNVVARSNKLPESEAREITAQILLGLNIMHAAKFAHRDMKPQNVLVVSCPPQSEWWIKLADFGLSKKLTESTVYRTRSGTPYYMAPELLSFSTGSSPLGYTNAVDMWATGCIIYRLITGSVPFVNEASLGAYCTKTDVFPAHKLDINGVTTTGIRFLQGLLASEPNERLSASQARQHEWIQRASESSKQSRVASKYFEQIGSGTSRLTSNTGYNTATHAGLQTIVEVTQNFQSGYSLSIVKPLLETNQSLEFRSQTAAVQSPTHAMQSGLKPKLPARNKPTLTSDSSHQEFAASQTPGNARTSSGQKSTNVESVRPYTIHPKEQIRAQDITIINSQLLTAAEHGHLEIVVDCFNKGASLEALDKDSCTPLHNASSTGSFPIVQLLLKKGANVNAVSQRLWTPLHIASWQGHQNIVQLLLDKGANMEVLDSGGFTALIYASRYGHLSVLQILLDKGSKINASDRHGKTALHHASRLGHANIVGHLLNKGANMEAQDGEGHTPLYVAMCEYHQEIANLLVDKGAAPQKPRRLNFLHSIVDSFKEGFKDATEV